MTPELIAIFGIWTTIILAILGGLPFLFRMNARSKILARRLTDHMNQEERTTDDFLARINRIEEWLMKHLGEHT